MDSNNRIAIFTIVNKEDVFRGFVDSLETQKNVSFELFPIMNCHGEYSSARHAYNEKLVEARKVYNEALRKAKGIIKAERFLQQFFREKKSNLSENR